MMRFLITLRILACLTSISMGPAFSAHAADIPYQISRRSPIKALPLQGRTKKKLEVWYKVFFKDGSTQLDWNGPPTLKKGVSHVMKYENNLERTLFTDGRGGGAILLNPRVVTYEIPTFWSGKAWLEEKELKSQSSKVHKRYYKKSLKENQKTSQVLKWLQTAKALEKFNYQLALAQYKLRSKEVSPKEKKYLKQKRIAHIKRMIKSYKTALKKNKSHYKPKTILACKRVVEEIVVLKKERKQWLKESLEWQAEINGYAGLKKKDHQLRYAKAKAQNKLKAKAISKLKKSYKKLKAQNAILAW